MVRKFYRKRLSASTLLLNICISFVFSSCQEIRKTERQEIKQNKVVAIRKEKTTKQVPRIYRQIKNLISKYNKQDSEQITALIFDASKTYKIPVEIITSVVWQESRFNPFAVSKSGCVGLMQVNPKVWKFPKEALLNPAMNINIGCGILRYYYDLTGSWKKALIRYYGVSDFAYNKYVLQVFNKIKKVKRTINMLRRIK